ncbi:ATPase [Pseudomonas sp. SK3(2021)]|uniref:BCAM0308 family protein n=1 Tax=Pseudomonas TaxID=286 RepID=UPI0004AC0DC4|nr:MULTISPECIES: BCAM0308 family protein [Pseudomonas]AIC20116.1 ATPase [Pseudomonas chlororaphis]QQZ39428.1 ATPase [Pseudomonas sp. SK3(2021)]
MDKYQQSQKNKLFKPAIHDPYYLQRIEGSAICSQCGAVYQAGNWTWKRPENTVIHDAQTVTCPACRRTEDNMPAGTLRLSGGFLLKHRDEIVHLLENTEKKEKADHALERIINLSDATDELIVTTTGIHLANRLGHALVAAFKGHSDYQYSDDEYGVSVNWTRDE